MRSLRIGVMLGLLTAGGCFYLADINERPRPRIQEKTTGPYNVDSEVIFSATGSRDDQSLAGLTVSWQALRCNAVGAACVPIGLRVTLPDTSSDFVVKPSGKGTLRVELTLTDKSGAFEKTTATVPVVNREPEIELQISREFPDPGDLGGFVLGLPVHLSAQVVDGDGDEVTLTWNYEAPSGAGSDPDDVTFEPVTGVSDTQALVGDVAGVWEVSVTADDGDGGVATATKQVVFAPDGPPCLGRLAPNVRGTDVVVLSGARTFSVLSAADALDPWPPIRNAHPQIGRTTFRWAVASPASANAFVPLDGHNLPELVLDAADHSPGDHLSLRVEVDDRVGRPVVCPVAEPICSAAANACSQRMTWEIEIR